SGRIPAVGFAVVRRLFGVGLPLLDGGFPATRRGRRAIGRHRNARGVRGVCIERVGEASRSRMACASAARPIERTANNKGSGAPLLTAASGALLAAAGIGRRDVEVERLERLAAGVAYLVLVVAFHEQQRASPQRNALAVDHGGATAGHNEQPLVGAAMA